MKRLTLILLLVLLGVAPLLAVERIQVVGLFRDSALLLIDGQRRLLRTGQRSPEGVRLVRATSLEAEVEVNGERQVLSLDRTMGGRYAAPDTKAVRIYRNRLGMFTTVGSINGLTVNFLVDTGASSVAINANEARRLGIDFRVAGQRGVVSTASGVAPAWRVTLDRVQVGDIELRNVQALVLEGGSPTQALLGMTFLGRLDMAREDQALVLRRKY